MAEPNESREQHTPSSRQPHAGNGDTGDKGRDADTEHGDARGIVDAEVVENSPAERPAPALAEHNAPPGGDLDRETFRQYQQFLRFQQFQEWQRHHDSGTPFPAGTESPQSSKPAGKPWWKRALRLLRFKFVRRVLYAVLALVLLHAVIDYYFGGSSSQNGGGTGSSPAGSSPDTATEPNAAVRGVYNTITDAPEDTCALFTASGQAAFARANNAPDCPTAVHRLHTQVHDPTSYAGPLISPHAMRIANGQALVSSCDIQVEGGPRLGKFKLRQLPDGGWVIEGYANEPAECSPS